MEDTVNTRLPRDLWDFVRRVALQENRSATAQLAVMVREVATAHKRKAAQEKAAGPDPAA